MSIVALWPPTKVLYVADAEAVKEITLSSQKFPKPLEQYIGLIMYGQVSLGRVAFVLTNSGLPMKNVVTTEGKEWKRHRKISAPAFSEVCDKQSTGPFMIDRCLEKQSFGLRSRRRHYE